MPSPCTAPAEENEADAFRRQRRRVALAVACAALLFSAVVVLLLPIRLPIYVRLFVAGTDAVAALVIYALLRRKR